MWLFSQMTVVQSYLIDVYKVTLAEGVKRDEVIFN